MQGAGKNDLRKALAPLGWPVCCASTLAHIGDVTHDGRAATSPGSSTGVRQGRARRP